MSERLARLEEMIRATESALLALQDGSADRLAVASAACAQSLEAGALAGDPDFRAVSDPEERRRLQEGISRLNDLTHLCRQEGEELLSALRKGQQRAGEVRQFLEASRIVTEQRSSEFDQEG